MPRLKTDQRIKAKKAVKEGTIPVPEPEQTNAEPEPEANAETSTAVVKYDFGQSNLAVAKISAPSTGEKVPWLSFFHPNAKAALEVRSQIKGISEGRAYVGVPTDDGQMTYLSVDEIFLVSAEEFYTETKQIGQDYKTLRASRSQTDPKLSREIVCTVLCVTSKGLIPAVCSFRGAKSNAAQVLAHAAREAGDWRAHVGTLRYEMRTSKTNGLNYWIVDAELRSIDAVTAKKLNSFFASEEMQEMASNVHRTWLAKCAEHDRMASV